VLSQDQSGLDTKCEETLWAWYPHCVSKFHPKQAMKALSGSGFISTLSLTSALGVCGCSTPRSGCFTRGKRPGTHCTGGWVGPRAGMDEYWKSCPTGLRSSDRPAGSESLYRLSYPGSHPLDEAHHKRIMKRSGISVWAVNNRVVQRCWPNNICM